MELNRRSFLESATAAGIALCMPGCVSSASARPGGVWKGWKKGRFQAHFIYTGVAESIFLVYPDSTTVMIDCGDHPAHARGNKAVPIAPDMSRHAGEWIARYVKRVNPNGTKVDYGILTHYHSDHGGGNSYHLGKSKNGEYWISGFGQVIDYLSFGKMIDRMYPATDIPLPLPDDVMSSTPGHMRGVYRELERRGTKVEAFRLELGSNQLDPVHGKVEGFSMRPLCANGRFLNSDGSIRDMYAARIREKNPKSVNENGLSIGMVFGYGPFRFYTAGDLSDKVYSKAEGLVSAEDEVAKICGRAHVAKINHHGHRSMSDKLVAALSSDVYLSCIWDQLHVTRDTMRRICDPANYGAKRMVCPGIFTKERQAEDAGESWIGSVPKSVYTDPCHVILDVYDEGKSYDINVVDATDEEMRVKAVYNFKTV
jgi:beta-lactamase superfamily II metal-dependent hydrolase